MERLSSVKKYGADELMEVAKNSRKDPLRRSRHAATVRVKYRGGFARSSNTLAMTHPNHPQEEQVPHPLPVLTKLEDSLNPDPWGLSMKSTVIGCIWLNSSWLMTNVRPLSSKT